MSGEICIIPTKSGKIESVYFGLGAGNDNFDYAKIISKLPKHTYHYVDQTEVSELMWALESYRFAKNHAPKMQSDKISKETINIIEAIYWVRDLINAPANQLSPDELVDESCKLKEYGAKIKVTSGSSLEKDYPAIFAIGNSSASI